MPEKYVMVRWAAWPSWNHCREALVLGFLLTLWFELVYGATNYVTAHGGHRLHVHFQCEMSIPFVPAMTIVYMSIFPLFWMSPFVMQTRQELRRSLCCVERHGVLCRSRISTASRRVGIRAGSSTSTLEVAVCRG